MTGRIRGRSKGSARAAKSWPDWLFEVPFSGKIGDGSEFSRLIYENDGVSLEKSLEREVNPVDPGFFAEDETEIGGE